MGKELIAVPEIKAEFISLIKELMEEHSITEQEVLYLLAKECNLVWSISGDSILKLFKKNLLSKDGTKSSILFRRYKPEQVTLDLAFESADKTNTKTKILFDNLWNKFIDEKEWSENKIEKIASQYFVGDKTIAKYFILFINLFPQRNIQRNFKWNKAFGIVFEGKTRQEWNVKISKAYLKVYKRSGVDPAILSSAVYFFIKDSINSTGEAYISKPQAFLDNYDYWYSFAETSFNKMLSKPNEKDNLIDI